MTKSRAAEPHAPRPYHRLSRQGRGLARPKPRPQTNTLDGYLRPAPQPPIELEPLLQEMKTMFSVQPISDVGSQPVSSPPVSSPPVSSPPTFNRIDNINGAQRCPNKNCTQKVPSKKRKAISTKTRLGKWLCSQTGQLPIGEHLGAAILATRPNARNGIVSVRDAQPSLPTF